MKKEIFSFAFIADPQIGMDSPSGLHEAVSDKARLDSAIAYIKENLINVLRTNFIDPA